MVWGPDQTTVQHGMGTRLQYSMVWGPDHSTAWYGDQTRLQYSMVWEPDHSTAWYGNQTIVQFGVGVKTMVLCLGEEVSMFRLHTSATAFPLDFAFSSFLLAAS